MATSSNENGKSIDGATAAIVCRFLAIYLGICSAPLLHSLPVRQLLRSQCKPRPPLHTPVPTLPSALQPPSLPADTTHCVPCQTALVRRHLLVVHSMPSLMDRIRRIFKKRPNQQQQQSKFQPPMSSPTTDGASQTDGAAEVAVQQGAQQQPLNGKAVTTSATASTLQIALQNQTNSNTVYAYISEYQYR